MTQARSYAQNAAPSEALAGTVERVTFHNAETGFAVLKVKARGKRDLITIVASRRLHLGGRVRHGQRFLGQRPHPWPPGAQGHRSDHCWLEVLTFDGFPARCLWAIL